jgi:hypothetical protein
MKEEKCVEDLTEKLKEKLAPKSVTVCKNKDLLYKVIIDPNFNYNPPDPKNPTRGNLAFRVDILILDNSQYPNYPLVGIEVKLGDITTHDIITYSIKALKHKELYPHLRYGLIICRSDERSPKINPRFFIHNKGFDFAVVLDDISNNDSFEKLVQILEIQLQNSRELLKLFNRNNEEDKKIKVFYTQITLEHS